MPRRNHRGGNPQAKRRTNQVAGVYIPPPPVDQVILPVGRCGRKLMFKAEDADKALKQARARRERKNQMYSEERHYMCPRCDHHHLTSRSEWTPKEDKS